MKSAAEMLISERKYAEPRRPRLAAFDFDLTLSSFRVYGRRDFSNLLMLFGGKERIDLLKEFFAFLDHHGVRIVIISWNFEGIISEALSALGLISHVHSIYDRRAMIINGGYEKGKHNIIEGLCRDWNLSRENVVLIDDSIEVLELVAVTEFG